MLCHKGSYDNKYFKITLPLHISNPASHMELSFAEIQQTAKKYLAY
jgi:hypothetical protein